jgi:hypothetical protein
MIAECWNGDGPPLADFQERRILLGCKLLAVNGESNHHPLNQCQISKSKFQMNVKCLNARSGFYQRLIIFGHLDFI